jgi:hypothetical protein
MDQSGWLVAMTSFALLSVLRGGRVPVEDAVTSALSVRRVIPRSVSGNGLRTSWGGASLEAGVAPHLDCLEVLKFGRGGDLVSRGWKGGVSILQLTELGL